jgi:hypothetical protein
MSRQAQKRNYGQVNPPGLPVLTCSKLPVIFLVVLLHQPVLGLAWFYGCLGFGVLDATRADPPWGILFYRHGTMEHIISFHKSPKG